ncbi:MAG TPA: lytic transglycosylase domain-containing protein [Polyangia bacterium]|nr:lytic transglycosylase domain-containing protein [Polyangia bacterium]
MVPRTKRGPALLAGAAAMALALGGSARAEIAARAGGDGVVEFSTRRAARADRASAGGTFWARERADGVVEFTNLPPLATPGGKWKVWLKTGPGKAAALRGRTDAVPPRDTSPARFARYDQHIHDQAAFFGIPEALMRAVIKTESDFDPNVVSSAGAQGLMQLLPETARLMGVTDVFDPRQNVMGGARYLQVLARRFCKTPAAVGEGGGPAAAARLLVCSLDEKIRVVAAYHAGPAAVERYGGVPPYETTRAYVAAVMRRYQQYQDGELPGAFVAER